MSENVGVREIAMIIRRCIALLVACSVFVGSLFNCGAEATVPSLSAKSAVLINTVTGTIIGGKNEHERRSIASVTKIMTALLLLEAGNLDLPFVVDALAIKIGGTSMGLREGDIVTRRALLYGILLPSGNDAASAAAVSVSGSEKLFVKLMNKRAAELGLENTHFANPHGLDEEGHYSSAYDLALLTVAAMKNADFREIVSAKTATLKYGNPPYTRKLKNNNKLLSLYDGAVGVKTGFTDDARRTLVGAAERDGVRLIAVTLNAPDDWEDQRKMFDYGFEVVKPREVWFDTRDIFAKSADGKTNVPVSLTEPIILPLAESEMPYIAYQYKLKSFLYAGYKKGDYAGTVTVTFKGKPLHSVNLVAAVDDTTPIKKKTFLEKLFGYTS
ncbi:MAG: D-alanyl-D-alanine carboxypeptidase [Oscillospiraceae bacterium]|nr:D-alanyl-D-alanine carboxypeptidase [Oscillospiraceae bacterium]